MNNREIAEVMRLDLNPEKERSSKQVASAMAERGEQLYVRAMGPQEWHSYRCTLRDLYHRRI